MKLKTFKERINALSSEYDDLDVASFVGGQEGLTQVDLFDDETFVPSVVGDDDDGWVHFIEEDDDQEDYVEIRKVICLSYTDVEDC